MNDAINAALKAIEDLRISGAGNFTDPKYAGQRGIDRADALYDAYQAVKTLSTPKATVEREGIARIVDPEAWTIEPWNYNWQEVVAQKKERAFTKADAILARLDEAAIRADEREKCANEVFTAITSVVITDDGNTVLADHASSAVRNGGKQPCS